jgi:subfamily B ATP-binding cassette protein MsbA
MIEFLRRLLKFLRPYRTRFILGLLCGIVFAMANALMILSIKLVVDVVFPGSTPHTIHDYVSKAPGWVQNLLNHFRPWLPSLPAPSSQGEKVLLICTIPVIMLFRAVFGYLNVYLVNWSAVRTVVDIRTTLFEHLQGLPLSFFSQARTGDLISRITSDTQTLYTIISNSLSSATKDPVTVIATLSVLLSKPEQRALTGISIIVLPACVVPIVIYGRKVRKSARAIQGKVSELATLMHESFTGNRIIKAYNLENAISQQFRETTKKFISHAMRVVRSNELPSQTTEFLGGVGVTLVLLYVEFVRGGRFETGDFVQFIGGIVIMYQPIKSLTRLHNQLHQAKAASERVFELLEMKSTMLEPANPRPLKAAGADIHFQGINFDYGEKPVLRGIDLEVKAGQFVALVGSSGSGKTTLLNLLPRFYDPQSGSVRIGDIDIRDVAIADLRRQIALVTQDTVLFHDTIRRNIALGRAGATDAEIEAAARHANAHEFILQKPLGYDTVIGEKGIQLSGGQRQRIAIARAIVKDAPILILDEATSSLDNESERIVQAALEDLMRNRTTICIAHRLSTIQKADVIIVLSEGQIVETGTHDGLMKRGGTYRRLYELSVNH